MPGKIIKEVLVDLTVPHECKGKPRLWGWKYALLDNGTQWQCAECDTIWELEISYSPHIGYMKGWVKIETKSPTRRRDHV